VVVPAVGPRTHAVVSEGAADLARSSRDGVVVVVVGSEEEGHLVSAIGGGGSAR
jgi:hypothetical protein